MSNISEKLKSLSPVKRAYFELTRALQRVESLENERNEPVAIVGMACRFPGGVESPEEYWNFLCNEGDGITEVPDYRWNIDKFYDPKPAPGKTYVRRGGFLGPVDAFDARFFGITPKEAETVDPQQRLLLETCVEAIEDAGIALDAVRNSRTGAFVGIMNLDYFLMQMQHAEPEKYDAYTGTGGAFSVAAGRISYALGLQGPNLPVDTACSSSLVTLHLAVRSLRNRECDLALAGGVNLFLIPESFILRCQANMLSPDGRCYTFDARANGYAPGEGCGVVALKRLSDAIRDDDRIYAVIRGSAVNHDGPSSGLTVPNGLAQKKLLESALADARARPEEIDYIECHGTGTPLGDPIEIGSIAAVYDGTHSSAQPLVLGSVKSNFGHLESAAGIAGVIKVALSLQHRKIPPNFNFEKANPDIILNSIPANIATTLLDWKKAGAKRMAGVSSFGVSGTNAHIVLEEAPERKTVAQDVEEKAHLLLLSAKSPEALTSRAGQICDWLRNPLQNAALSQLAYNLALRRTHFDHRLALVARTPHEAIARLDLFASGASDPRFAATRTRSGIPVKIYFAFSGQGSQWPQMGAALLRNNALFRAKLEEIDALIKAEAGWSVIEEILRPEENTRLGETEFAQPAIFAVQMGLVEILGGHGVYADAVVGHSVGEVAAACVAGAFSLTDAVRVILHRARVMQEATGNGKMAAAGVSLDEAQRLINRLEGKVAIGAVNSPRSIVFSGESAAIEQLVDSLPEGVFKMMLPVNYAFHSPQMEPFKDKLIEGLRSISTKTPTLPHISTVTGQLLKTKEDYSPEYWARNMRETVNFAQGVFSLVENNEGYGLFIEVGPHSTLTVAIEQCLRDFNLEGAVTPSLRRKLDDEDAFLMCLGRIHGFGGKVDLAATIPPSEKISLPAYPWQREKYWALSASELSRPRKRLAAEAPLDDWLYEVAWERSENSNIAGEIEQSNWLLFADRGGVAARIMEAAAQFGAKVAVARAGAEYAKISAGEYALRPHAAEDIRRFIEEQSAHSEGRNLKVVHLWNLDCAEYAQTNAESLANDANLGLLSIVSALQALAARSDVKVWLATAGANGPAESPDSALAPAAAWGLARAIAVEQRQLWGGIIDVDPSSELWVSGDQIIQEILRPDGEDQIAFRGGERFVARLKKSELQRGASKTTVHSNAAYLVTGGLTGIGVLTARWLADSGAKTLVLLGRTPLPDRTEWQKPHNPAVQERIAAVLELEERGVTVITDAVDTADAATLSAFLRKYEAAGHPQIRGVVHSAGVLEGKTLAEMDAGSLHKVLQPKTAGAWNLHAAFLNDLDFLIFYSSVSGVFPGMGESVGNYSAANAFLDGLARRRRALGMSAISVIWGPWREIGFASQSDAGDKMVHNLASRGVHSIAPKTGTSVLNRLLSSRIEKDPLIIQIDWEAFSRSMKLALQSPLLRHFQALRSGSSETDNSGSGAITAQAILTAPDDERGLLITAFLKDNVADIMRYPKDKLDPDRSLKEIGIDSLMGVELRNRIERDLSYDLSAARIVDGSSINGIAALIARKFSVNEAHANLKAIDVEPSMEQRSAWFLAQLASRSYGLSVYRLYEVEADLNPAALRNALQMLTGAYEILRTNLVSRDGLLMQRIAESREPDFEFIDGASIDSEELYRQLSSELNRRFDFEKDVPLRSLLIRIEENRHLLALISHRGVMSESGLDTLFLHLADFHASGTAPTAPALQYKNYADHQRLALESDLQKQVVDLAGDWQSHPPEPLWMSNATHAAISASAFRVESHSLEVDDSLSAAMRSLAQATDSTEPEVLAAAFAGTLAAVFSSEDFGLGLSVESNIDDPDFAKIPGAFSNIVPLRITLDRSSDFAAVSSLLRDKLRAGRRYAAVPFAALVSQLAPSRDLLRFPLCQTVIRIESRGAPAVASGLQYEKLNFPAEESWIELELRLETDEEARVASCSLIYRSAILSAPMIKSLAACITNVLMRAAQTPDLSVSKLVTPVFEDEKTFTLPSAREAGLGENWLKAAIRENETISELIDSVSELTPGLIALKQGAREITYRELRTLTDLLAQQIADLLDGSGVQTGENPPLIALVQRNSIDAALIGLSVLKSGCALMPLDPGYSPSRINVFLHDAKPDLIVAQGAVAEQLRMDGFACSAIEIGNVPKGTKRTRKIRSRPKRERVALVLYRFMHQVVPVGAETTHSALKVAVLDCLNDGAPRPGIRTLAQCSQSSPAMPLEIFSALANGGMLIFDDSTESEIDLLRSLVENEIERIFISSARLARISEISLAQGITPSSLNEVIITGRRAPRLSDGIRGFFSALSGCKLTYIFTLAEFLAGGIRRINRPSERNEPVGAVFPGAGAAFKLLTADGEPTASGASGELYVRGPGLARGYRNRPDLTAERFVSLPGEEGVAFQSGLLARVLSDQSMVVQGVLREQSSTGGNWINLQHISEVIEEHPAIKQAYVLYNPEIPGNKLIGYIVSDKFVDRLPMMIRCQAEVRGESPVTLITQDLSPRGLKLQGVPEHWRPDLQVNLSLLLPGFLDLFHIPGRIRWHKDGAAGIEFETTPLRESMLKRSLDHVFEVQQFTMEHQGNQELRVPVNRRCVVSPDDEPALELTANEISIRGISLLGAPDQWIRGMPVNIRLALPGWEEPLSIRAILASRDDLRTGFNFVAGEDAIEKIGEFINNHHKDRFLSIAGLRSFLRSRLPARMIPDIFVALDALPQLPHGSVNQSALRFPYGKWFEAELSYVSPRTAIEGIIASLWSQAIGPDKRIGVNNDFFDLGGDSLTSAQLVELVNKEFDLELRVRDLYMHPTVAELASLVIVTTAQKEKNRVLDEALADLENLSIEDLKAIVRNQLLGDEESNE